VRSSSNPRLLFTRHRVLATPTSPARLLRRPPGNPERPFPLNRPGVLTTFSGRAALDQAAILLGLSAEDVVLCPAYCCGHEIEPFLRRNVEVGFFNVDRRLEIDLDDLRRKLDERTRAILVTHYFGFPQNLEPVRELCAGRDIVLIEDCAHSFLSRDARGFLGETGDLAVFSMRKTVPIPHGGALLANRFGTTRPPLASPPPAATWVKAMHSWEKSLLARTSSTAQLLASRLLLLLALPSSVAHRGLKLMRAPGSRDSLDGSFGYDSRVLSWGMAPLALRILDNVDLEQVVDRRRSNFQILLEALGKDDSLRPLLGSLPEGVCPLTFPVVVSRGTKLVQQLQARGIAATMWWNEFHPAVPWQHFPDSCFLKNQVLALPIHQDLDEDHMRRMIRELERA
jgi:dTDP-4-amino-4,6-dideoxygalactose transaminase